MPQYRVEFFRLLKDDLVAANIELHIYYGDTPREWVARNDSAVSESATRLKTDFVNVRGRNLSYKHLTKFKQDGPFDLVILEQAIRNIETYELLIRNWRRKNIAFWGHGKTYTARQRKVEERLKTSLTLKGAWFFAYTEGGSRAVRDSGYPESRITVVQNSIDTTSLRRDYKKIETLPSHQEREDTPSRSTNALYIGGVDSSKRIEFLIEAARKIHQRNNQFRLTIAGSGDDADDVISLAKDVPWLDYIGPVFQESKAAALHEAAFLMNPGRVGLVAVDSLVTGRPIVTTKYPYHAPEFEYLENGRNCVVSDDDIDDYVEHVLSLISDHKELARLSANCTADSGLFDLDSMVENFSAGVQRALRS